jgi:hypothetical protein
MRLKLTYLTLLFLFFGGMANAQVLHQFGFQGGLSFSNQRWEYRSYHERDYRRSYRIGFNGSGFIESVLGKHWRIQLGAGANQKGFREKLEVTSAGVQGTQELITNNVVHYGNYWLGTKYRFNGEKRTLYLLLLARIDVHGGRAANTTYDVYFNKMKPWYPGAAYGAGFIFPIGRVEGFVEITHNPDLIPAFDRQRLQIFNNSIEVKFGMLLPGDWIKKAVNPNYVVPRELPPPESVF